MIHFCTYFDRNYLTRAIAMHRSLLRHSSPFTLWALCLDDEAFAAISSLDLDSLRRVELLGVIEEELVATERGARHEHGRRVHHAITSLLRTRGIRLFYQNDTPPNVAEL